MPASGTLVIAGLPCSRCSPAAVAAGRHRRISWAFALGHESGRLRPPYSTQLPAHGAAPDVLAPRLIDCRDVLGTDADKLTALWRDKQLQYTWLRSLAGHYVDFWQVRSEERRVGEECSSRWS